jgi:GrpB-like predicted nucleotidyltransferase (UPF0157 family)
MTTDVVEIAPYTCEWPDFEFLGRSWRNALGDVAIRIDRIGSLTVPGLVASRMPARSEKA